MAPHNPQGWEISERDRRQQPVDTEILTHTHTHTHTHSTAQHSTRLPIFSRGRNHMERAVQHHFNTETRVNGLCKQTTKNKTAVPVPVPQRCGKYVFLFANIVFCLGEVAKSQGHLLWWRSDFSAARMHICGFLRGGPMVAR